MVAEEMGFLQVTIIMQLQELDMLKNKDFKRIDKRYDLITKNHETLDKETFKKGAMKRLETSGIATEDVRIL